MNSQARPLGGPILTNPFKALLLIFGVAAALIVWRFAVGLGPTTALSDGYPWGLWIAFDVVTGTALACGGYAMALLVYILNRGRYHPLIRPAILTSALGYSVAGISLAVDVGRPWNFWRVPVFVNQWNFNSALLEVALCIMSYVGVVWVEASPAFLEKLKESPTPWLRSAASKAHAVLDRALIWIIALGFLLPTMHQSSLGTLMILTGRKLHPLWQTPLLPLLFLLSSFLMGYAMVVFESILSSILFKSPRETRMLASLSRAVIVVAFLFLAIRLIDLTLRSQWASVFAFDRHTMLLLAEWTLLLVPVVSLLSARRRSDGGHLFGGAMLLILAGALYRFDAFLIAFDPGQGWSYFPSVPEILITLGLVALEIMAYVILVKRFPFLTGSAPAGAGR